MNKTDLFRAKLVTSPIYEYYSDYEGPSDYPTGCAYMQSKFTPLYRNGSIHPLHCLFTCATGSSFPTHFRGDSSLTLVYFFQTRNNCELYSMRWRRTL